MKQENVDPVSQGLSTCDGAQSAKLSIGPREVLHGVRRRWHTSLIVGLVCASLAAHFVWAYLEPKYLSYGQLRVSSVTPKVAFNTFQSASSRDFKIYKNTQLQLVYSYNVLSKALEDPEVKKCPSVMQQTDAVQWLASQITAHYPRNAEILQVGMRGDDAPEITLITNAVIDAYLDQVVKAERASRQQSLEALEHAYRVSEERVREMREKLDQLVKSSGAGSEESEAIKRQIAMQRFVGFQRELMHTQLELMHSELSLVAAQVRLDQPAEEISVSRLDLEARINADPFVQAQEEQVAQNAEAAREAKRLGREKTLGPYLGRLEESRKVLADYKANLTKELKAEFQKSFKSEAAAEVKSLEESINVLRAQEKRLSDNVKKMGGEVGLLGISAKGSPGSTSVEHEMIRSGIGNVDQITEQLSNEIETLRVELSSPNRVTLVHKAWEPQVTENNSRINKTATASLAAFLVSILLIGVKEARSQKINVISDVAKVIPVDVIGALPFVPSKKRRPKKRLERRRNSMMVAYRQAIDSVRTLVERDASLRSEGIFQVVSAVSGEGKTTLALQLAKSMSRSGLRTLLMDCDIYRGEIHQVFDLERSPGVCEVLNGASDLPSAIQLSTEDNLWILPSGDGTQDSIATTPRGILEQLFDTVRAQFDIVIVDGPPVLPVVDAIIMAQHVDGVLFSIFRDLSEARNIRSACDRLQALDVRIVGAVVTSDGIASDYSNYGYDGSQAASGGNLRNNSRVSSAIQLGEDL